MITKNTYTKHGVANGTKGTMHSLTWQCPEDVPALPNEFVPGTPISRAAAVFC